MIPDRRTLLGASLAAIALVSAPQAMAEPGA